MKRAFNVLIVIALILASACNHGKHFISDRSYRRKMESQFEKTKELAKNRADQLFSVFQKDLTLEKKEALQFLFAYMPLSDLADYDGEFYLKNVSTSLAARDTFSWGKQIPEEIFRHFVLPVRVNNENLDSSRWVFFDDLKGKIKNLTMKEAALEVNHWCHEKVTYRGSDMRTSSPLATVKTAYGRCGEESTFTVAALRSACIPARQCYTPRWAHSDDNHAWVEVWIDGKWHYIGACEPEPDLDLAWFTGPAKRAMLVNTNVFGDYSGSEDILVKDQRYTKINILPNYTKTKRIYVKVVDIKNQPVDNATVEFQLYNYAEFYALHRIFTDDQGFCSFLTGFGDLLVWTAKKNAFGYRKVTIKDIDTVVIELSHTAGKIYSESFDLTPPPEQKVDIKISDSVRKENNDRFAFEDRMRANYEQTFIDSGKTIRLANNLKINADTLWMILKKSRGNWRDIIEFISSAPENRKSWIFPLLLNISEKDLRDITTEVLTENLTCSWQYEPLTNDYQVKSQYLLNPRVDNEFLKPYKKYFQEKFDKPFIEKARKDPKAIIDWIKGNIQINLNANYGRAPLTPTGVFDLKLSDEHSRDILFVGICRSFGIPARLETATKNPQYIKEGKWVDVWFEKKPEQVAERGTLVIQNDKKNDRRPEYYTHFTVEKFSDGFYRSLDYETDPVMQQFPATIDIAPAPYLLVTGNRMADGTVLTNLSFFTIETGKVVEQSVVLRKNQMPLPSYGELKNIKPLFQSGDKTADFVFLNNGIVIAWLEPDKEPSRHFTDDLIQKKAEFNQWSGSILLLFKSEPERISFLQKNNKELPKHVISAIGSPESTSTLSAATGRVFGTILPIITYINPNGGIIYLSEGYKIGIGDDLLKCIHSRD